MEFRREPMFESEPKKTAPTLAEFAKKSQITEDKVWELIEEGQVSARFVNESILIMQDHPSLDISPAVEVEGLGTVKARDPDIHREKDRVVPKDSGSGKTKVMDSTNAALATKPKDIRQGPDFAPEPRVSAAGTEPQVAVPKTTPKLPSFLEKSFKYPANPAPEAEFQSLDIPSNSSDLLVFAQDALSHNNELSKELLATKNELIRLKDERIAFLSDLLAQRDKDIRSLNRKLEELATLSNFESR